MDPILANTQLILRERWARDNHYWHLAEPLYTDDCQVHVSFYKGSAAGFTAVSKKMVAAGGMQIWHTLQSPIVYVDSTQTKGTVLLGATVTTRSTITDDSDKKVLVDTDMHTQLVFTTTKVGDEWKIASFQVIYMKDTMSPAIPGQTIHVDPASLKGVRSSYQLLSWGIAKRGIPIDPDLPGPDRPEMVKEVFDRALEWVGVPTK